MLNDALKFWDSISGKVKDLIKDQTSNCVKRRRYDVTTAPDGNVIGVTPPFGKEIFIPYSRELEQAQVGDTVLVEWWNSLSTARADFYGAGPNPASSARADELQRQITSLGAEVTALEASITGMVYPVGSIYVSVNSVSPAVLFGGTWERIQDTFLLASGSSHAAGTTGGAETVTLTTNQIPSHAHGIETVMHWPGVGSGYGYPNWNYISEGIVPSEVTETNSAGGGQAHNNMPPYLAVYVWKRTA